jgi:hypothetical protein
MRTRCNFYVIVSKSNSGKITPAVSNQLMEGRWYWDIQGYEIGRMLGNEVKVEWRATITYLGYVIIIPWKVILTNIIRWY